MDMKRQIKQLVVYLAGISLLGSCSSSNGDKTKSLSIVGWTSPGVALIDELDFLTSVHRWFTLNLDTGITKPVTMPDPHMKPIYLDPSSNASLLAITDDSKSRIYLSDKLFKSPKLVCEIKGYVSHAILSRDGQSIALCAGTISDKGGFVGRVSGHFDLWLMSSNGKNLRRVSNRNWNGVANIAFSKDAKELIVGAELPDGICSVNIATNNIRSIVLTATYSLALSTDGDTGVYTDVNKNEDTIDIWKFRGMSGSPTRVTNLDKRITNLCFSQDNKNILFVVDESQLWSVGLDGNGSRKAY